MSVEFDLGCNGPEVIEPKDLRLGCWVSYEKTLSRVRGNAVPTILLYRFFDTF